MSKNLHFNLKLNKYKNLKTFEKLIVPCMVFLSLFLLAAPIVRAADSNWVTVGSIYDLTDNVTLQPGKPLIAGHGYNVTMTIDVPFTQSQSQFEVFLNGQMSQKATQFWYRISEYPGYDASKFTAGLRTISFNQVQGQLVLVVIFSVPSDYAISQAGGLSLHTSKSDIRLITIQVTGGSTVGTFNRNISDEAIERYLAAYSERSNYLSQGKIDSAYSNVVNGVLAQAQAIYAKGLPDDALAIVNNVNPDSFPAPPSNMSLILIIIVVVMAAVAGLFGMMFLRTKTRLGNLKNIANEIQRELAAVEVSATQYDEKLSQKLAVLKNKIGEAFE